MNSIFKDFLKLKKASNFKKYFDHHCYVACLETLLSPVINSPGYRRSPIKPNTKLYKLRDYKRKSTDGTDHHKDEFGVFLF